MRIAVIGAGVVGVTTAYELAVDGHEVVVFERRSGVAAETSFANAGIVAPGMVMPWGTPGMPARVLRNPWGAGAPLRLRAGIDAPALRWLWNWRRACGAVPFEATETEWLHRGAGGVLSSRDTLRARVGDAEITVDYGETHHAGQLPCRCGAAGCRGAL